MIVNRPDVVILGPLYKLADRRLFKRLLGRAVTNDARARQPDGRLPATGRSKAPNWTASGGGIPLGVPAST